MGQGIVAQGLRNAKLVETGESRTPRPESFPLEYATGLSGNWFSLSRSPAGRDSLGASRWSWIPRYRRCGGCTSTYGARSTPSRRGEGGRGSRVRLPGLLYFRQLLFCRLVDEVDGTPACNPARPPPVETTRPQLLFRYGYCTTPRVFYTALSLLKTVPQAIHVRESGGRIRLHPRAAARIARPASRSCSRSMMLRRLSWSWRPRARPTWILA